MSMADEQHLVQVAVDQAIDGELTYRVPPALRAEVGVGARVVVPLGRGNRLVNGTVLALGAAPPRATAPAVRTPGADGGADEVTTKTPLPGGPDELELDAGLFGEIAPVGAPPAARGGLKEIADVWREIQAIPADLLALARWMALYYCTPIGLVLASMVPAAVKKAVRLPVELWVGLGPAAPPAKLSRRAATVLESLRPLLADGPRRELEVMEKAAVGRPLLKRLADRGLVTFERRIIWPTPETSGGPAAAAAADDERLTLTADQARGLADIEALLSPPRFAVRVIHGVTGSGKTELYIRAIEKVVAAGKRAIVLVPEISLTPQAVARFTRRFGRVAVLHSGLRDTQRHLHWHAIATGWAQVIVGARSAIFAPVADLGLIVVDEEHDPSYKQDAAPRYHGRDVAIRRAQMLNVPVLLGSATPALESWHNARHNPHYGLISLPTRPGGTLMPRVVVVDMRTQTKERRGLHILSTHLEHQLKQTLEQKKQAIFLLNRRGYAHYVMCPRCDWVMMCERCDATMVVHRSKTQNAKPKTSSGEGDAAALSAGGGEAFHRRYGMVACHYCLTEMMLPAQCPACQAKLTYLGQGTQRAEDEILRKFPAVRMARMDSDSMGNLADYHRTLTAFGRGEIDLLIGTQMISKGLDFPNVGLVGVLNADLAMTMPDFRAAERTFQLICQVAGRSGRPGGTSRGTVVVQTFQPHEPAILHASQHDYEGFVQSELPQREPFGYPPFGRLVRVVLSDRGYTKVQEATARLMKLVEEVTERGALPVRWHGPQPPPMERLVEKYRVEVLFFARTPGPLQRLLAGLRQRGAFGQAGVDVAVDVDPAHMM